MNEAKIMILEDEAIVADDILHCLEQTGYLVPAICSSGEQLISRLEKETADLVLVDVMLAGKMDGIDTARIIRERFKIPVVYLSSFTNQTMLERARETFPSGYIVKPFKKRELLATVEMALYPRRSIQKSISNIHSGIGMMITRCWLSFLRQNLDHPEIPRKENKKSEEGDFQKAKSEKLVLFLGKIIGSSQIEFPELSDILDLVQELITILHPKFNLEAKTSRSDSIPVMDSILLVDVLLFILDRFQVDHRLQEINLEVEHIQVSSGDPDIFQDQQNNKVVLKISSAAETSLRPESSSISLDSLPAWTIYQNAFASQGSRIRQRGPQDHEQADHPRADGAGLPHLPRGGRPSTTRRRRGRRVRIRRGTGAGGTPGSSSCDRT